jgi:hypothetical protein
LVIVVTTGKRLMIGYPTRRLAFPSERWLDVSNSNLAQTQVFCEICIVVIKYFSVEEKSVDKDNHIQYIMYESYRELNGAVSE